MLQHGAFFFFKKKMRFLGVMPVLASGGAICEDEKPHYIPNWADFDFYPFISKILNKYRKCDCESL